VNIDLAALPSDADTLHQLVRDLAAQVADDRSELAQAQAEIERLKLIIRRFQRAQFGRRSERIDGDQLALGLEDVDADIARLQARHPVASVHDISSQATSRRKGLPDHLPREDVSIDIDERVCPCCGGALHVIGETVSEMLDFVPARLRVLRIRRPKYGCRACGTIHQAPAPERPIAKGMASPGLLAHVLVSKYCDHTPIYRQSQIFARHGVEIERSTLANWVGGACWWLEPLQARAEAIRYTLSRWPALCHFLNDNRIDLDNNSVERAIRPVAMTDSFCTGSDGLAWMNLPEATRLDRSASASCSAAAGGGKT
jgi:transposase